MHGILHFHTIRLKNLTQIIDLLIDRSATSHTITIQFQFFVIQNKTLKTFVLVRTKSIETWNQMNRTLARICLMTNHPHTECEVKNSVESILKKHLI